MALPFTQINAITQQLFIPVLIDQFFRGTPLLDRLKAKRDFYDGATQINQPVIYRGTTGGSYSGLDTFNTTPQENKTAAAFTPKQYEADITIVGKDARANENKLTKVIDLIKSEVMIAEYTMEENVGTDLFLDGTGNGSKAIDGLQNGIDDGTTYATYGSINGNTNTWWKSQVDLGAARAITLKKTETLFGACTFGGKRPSIIVTTQAIWDWYWNNAQSAQRFLDMKAGFSIGATGITLNGVPIVVDLHCPSQMLFMINEEFFHFKSHRNTFFKLGEFVKPSNQDAYVAQVFWEGDAIVSGRRYHGKATGYDDTK